MTEPRYDFPRSLRCWLCRSLIRAASLLVPRARRDEWVEEWEAELWHVLKGASRTSPFALCRGVLPHALWERRNTPPHPEPRGGLLGNLLLDLRYALRSFRAAPGYFVMAVTMLAIGIGATTAIFSIIDGVLLRPLPYRDPARLVVLGTVYENFPSLRGLTSTSAPNFLDWQERSRSFEAMAGIMNWQSMTLYGEQEPERVRLAQVSAELFSILGIGPSIGRTFAPEEYELGAPPVAILSYGLWQRRFGGDAGVVGRTIQEADRSFTVVGVMPASLTPPDALWVRQADLWMPVDFRDPQFVDRRRRIMRVVGRLRPDVSLRAARDEMDALASALIDEHPDELVFRGSESRIGVAGMQQETVGDIGTRLFVLLGAVGFLLLIACANVANLTLARGTSREREMALRSALGAGRGRLVGQLVTEGVVMAVVGGAAGVGVAFAAVKAFLLEAPGNIPRLTEVTIDGRVLAFTLTVSVATGLLFSLAPIAQSTGARLGVGLKEGARGSLGVRASFYRRGLVVTETALALVLLVGAGLLMNSFVRLNQVNPGFDPENVFTAPIEFGAAYTMEQRDVFLRELVERVDALPGVISASAVVNVPIGDVDWRTATFAEGTDSIEEDGEPTPVNIHLVYPSSFATLGIRILQGRDFTPQDRKGGLEVAIVNESLARLHWPNGDALGGRIRVGFEPEEPWLTVVGVVNDVHQAGLASEPLPQLYRAYPQGQEDWMERLYLIARHEAGVELAPAVRDEVRALDPRMALSGLGSFEDRISRSIREPRFYSSLLTSFALVALFLAGFGIYGTVLYSVGHRAREVGIRMALGARAKDVTRLILRQEMAPVALGMAIGLLGAMALSHLLSSFLFGVTSHDFPTFAAVASCLGLVALAGCLAPARRAARTQPVTTLRSE